MSKHRSHRSHRSHKSVKGGSDTVSSTMLSPQSHHEVQPELQTKQEVTPTSFYKTFKLSPQSGSAVTLGQSQIQTTFEIPASNVYNFYDTALSGQINIPSQGANYTVKQALGFDYFNRVEVFTADSQIYLSNIQDNDKYSKASGWYELDPKDRTPADGYCFNSRRNFSGFGVSGQLTTDDIGECDPMILHINGAGGPALQALAADLIDPAQYDNGGRRVFSNAIAAGATGTSFFINAKMRDICPSSIWSVNRDVFTQKIYVRITWNIQNLIFSTATAPTNGAPPVFGQVTGSAPGATAGNGVIVGSFNMILRIQANQEITSIVRKNAQRVSQIVIPDITTNTFSVSQNGTQQTTMKVTSQTPNARLYKTFYIIADPSNPQGSINDTNNLAYQTALSVANTSNYASDYGNWTPTGTNAKYDTIFEYMQGNLIMGPLSAAANEDYKYCTSIALKHGFKSLQMYKLISSFYNLYDTDRSNQNNFDGRELRGMEFGTNEIVLQHQFQVLVTANNTYTHYLFACVMKQLYMLDGVWSFAPFT